VHLARHQGLHTEVDCSAPSYKYWHVIRSWILYLCQIQLCTKASRWTRCQCHCAQSHFVYSNRIRYASRPSQLPYHQFHVTRVAKTSRVSFTLATLPFDRKPAIVHLASPFAPSRSPYHSINTDSVGTHKSPIRPAALIISVHMDLPFQQAVDRSGRRMMSAEHTFKRPAPAMHGHAEPPRDLAG
jgi:hypothetical protein